jgi:hypothetical protein
VEVIADTSILSLQSEEEALLVKRIPGVSRTSQSNVTTRYSGILSGDFSGIDVYLQYSPPESNNKNPLEDAGLKVCTDGHRAFQIIDSTLSANLPNTKKDLQTKSAWTYTNLPEEIYNRPHFTWDLSNDFIVELSWDTNDTACVKLSLYKALEEGDG